jgi:hypothetical protein
MSMPLSTFLAVENLPLDPLNVAVGGLMIAVAMSMGAVALLSLGRRDRAQLGPTMRRLCRALGVARRDRRLIRDLARRAGAPGAALLVSRGCFDRAAVEAATPEHARLAALRRRLFE